MAETLTHWKKLTNPNYLGAYSFNEGEEKTLTIKEVKTELVKGEDGKDEQCTIAYFMEKEKPMILNKTNCKIIQKLYKTPFIERWANRRIIVHVESVKSFGDYVDALRIKKTIPPAPKTTDLKCVDCKEPIKAFGKTSAQQIATMTYEKYGKHLCADCAAKEKARMLEDDKAAALTDALDEIADEPETNQVVADNTENETENT